jgi:hypothetical protein
VVKRPGREYDQSPSYSAVAEKRRAMIPLPLRALRRAQEQTRLDVNKIY